MGVTLQHYLNPLHVYCRLRDVGFTKGQAMTMGRFYERTLFKLAVVNKNISNQPDDDFPSYNLNAYSDLLTTRRRFIPCIFL
jgi:hypothetical protein